MNKLKLILAVLFLAALASAQSSIGGGAALPAPGSAGLCLVSTSASAYGWGACSGSAATAFSALTPSVNSTAGTYTFSGGANLSIGTGSSASATGTGTITATAAPWTGLTAFPTACTNQAVTAVGTTLTCTTLTSAYVNNTIALTGTDINTSNQVTVTHLATALPIAQGGTSGTTRAAAFDALSPVTTQGDLIYRNASTNTRLAPGTATQLLHSGTTPSWSAISLTADVTGTLPLLSGGTGTAAASAAAAFDALSPTTTRGDLIVRGISVNGRLAVGSAGTCLTSDGTDAAWGSCATGSLSGTGTSNTMSKFTGTATLGNSLLSDNATALTYTGSGGAAFTGGIVKLTEVAAPTGSAGAAWLYADSTAHRLKAKNASDTAVNLVISGVDINTSDQVTATHLAAPLPTAQGGTGQTSTATFPTSGTIPVTGTCTSQVVIATTASGVTCATITASYVDTSVAITGVDISTSSTVTVTHLAAPLPSSQGGTANGFFTVSGPITAAKTFTFPNASATVLTDNAAVTIAQGGTGATTKAAAFNALSPMTTAGDIIYGGASGTGTRLAAGTTTQLLHGGTTPSWSAISLTADVSGALPIANGGTANTTATASFDALAPTTTQGDLILRGVSSNARLALGTNGQCLTSNGTTAAWGSCSTGSVTGTSLVATQVAVASSSTAITSYSAFTSDSSGNVTVNSLTATGSGVAGTAYLGQGTAASLGTTAVGLTAPTAVTSYNAVVPSAAGSGYLKFSSSVNQTGCTASASNLCGFFESAISLTADISGTLPVGNGGSGASSLPIHTVLIGNGASPLVTVGVGATGTIFIGNSAADPSFSANPVLGSSASTTSGSLGFGGATSGIVTVKVQAAAGTYNFNLPTTAGTAAQCLQSAGGGASAMTWGSCGSAPQLNTIVSAVAANTPLANGDNAQVWGWQQTTSGSIGMLFNESGAGTAAGTPYLIGIQTAFATTVNPLIVTAGGTTNGIRVLKSSFLTSAGTGGIDSNMLHCDVTDGTKCMTFTLSGITTATTRALAVPNAATTLIGSTNSDTTTTHVLHASATGFVGTFSAIAAGDLPSTLSSGTAITNAALTTPAIGAATGTSLSLGTDNSVAGTVTLANGSAAAHTIFGSGATTTNTINGFAAVPTTGHLIDCTVTTTTCLLHDSGVVTANVVNASSPGVGIAHFAGSTQTVTSSLIVAADITSATITGTQIASSIALAGSPTTTTQSAKDNSTKIATTAYVDAATGLTAGTSVTLTAPRQYFVCTGTCTITVPVPAAGYEFCVLNDDNVATAITFAAIGSSAMYENTARTAYGTAGTGTLVATAVAGNKMCLLGRDSTHYLVASFNGTWTAN